MYLVQSSKVLDWWIDKGTIGILHPWYGVYYVRYNVKWHADREPQTSYLVEVQALQVKKVHRNICGRASASVYTHVWRKFVESITEKRISKWRWSIRLYLISNIIDKMESKCSCLLLFSKREIYVLKIYFLMEAKIVIDGKEYTCVIK